MGTKTSSGEYWCGTGHVKGEWSLYKGLQAHSWSAYMVRTVFLSRCYFPLFLRRTSRVLVPQPPLRRRAWTG